MSHLSRIAAASLLLAGTLGATPLDDVSPEERVDLANKAVVAILDERSGDTLVHGTSVSEKTVVTKASEIEEVPAKHLTVRGGARLPVTDIWVDKDNDIAVLTVDGKLPEPAPLAASKDLPQGRLVRALTGGDDTPPVGTIGVAAREIKLRNGVLGVGLQVFFRQRQHPVIITEVFPGGGAEAAGLMPGDTILSIDGDKVQNSRELIENVFSHLPGEVVKLRVFREGEEFDQDVTLAHMTVLDPVDFVRARNISISGPISKRVSGFTSALQHDIALSPKQMGTPLVDTHGRVVALNIARADRLTTYALPAAVVRRALKAARSDG